MNDKIKIGLFVASCILSIAGAIIIWHQQNTITKEQEKLNHRLDFQDALVIKGITNIARDRETEAIENREHAEKILAHCKNQPDGCKLPPELTILPSQRKIDSIDSLLIKK